LVERRLPKPKVAGSRPVVRLLMPRRLLNQHRLRSLREAAESYPAFRNRRDDAALKAVMTAVLRPDSSCIDVGANVGAVLREMVRLAPGGRHLAFEPLSDHAGRLAAEFPQVDVRAVALADRNAEWQFMRRPDSALSSLETVPAGEDPETWRGPVLDSAQRVTVPVRRLDDELPEGFAPSLVKIDVEGVEYAVLEGARETLQRHRPVVALEHSIGATHHGYEAGGIHEILSECGLRLFDSDFGGPYTRDALEREVLGGRMWFFFAFPE
jgi:FkbM family methyltransferase